MAAMGHKRAVSSRSNAVPLFDDLVGAAEQRQRNGEAERLGSPEIDGHLDFRDLLNRQVGSLLPLRILPV
jgi:hypothetical protein